MTTSLKPVDYKDDGDVDFLYRLLEQRPFVACISHRRMPTFHEHYAFVATHPYTAWYIIMVDGMQAGAIYLSKQDEIGVHVAGDPLFQPRKQPLERLAISKLMEIHPRARYYANVAPFNQEGHALFQELGGRIVQQTYELSGDPDAATSTPPPAA